MRKRRPEESDQARHERRVRELADTMLQVARLEYPEASEEAQRATAALWCRQAAERIRHHG